VNIIVARREGVLVVPNRAIQTNRQTGKSYVEKWVAGQAVRTEVQIGLQDDLNSEVIKGLSEGDRVVLQAAARSSSSSPQPFMGGPPP
jgi:macrolide-specific efflux system membrane fusion protein